jgi:hypothetical protein
LGETNSAAAAAACGTASLIINSLYFNIYNTFTIIHYHLNYSYSLLF